MHCCFYVFPLTRFFPFLLSCTGYSLSYSNLFTFQEVCIDLLNAILWKNTVSRAKVSYTFVILIFEHITDDVK